MLPAAEQEDERPDHALTPSLGDAADLGPQDDSKRIAFLSGAKWLMIAHLSIRICVFVFTGAWCPSPSNTRLSCTQVASLCSGTPWRAVVDCVRAQGVLDIVDVNNADNRAS